MVQLGAGACGVARWRTPSPHGMTGGPVVLPNRAPRALHGAAENESFADGAEVGPGLVGTNLIRFDFAASAFPCRPLGRRAPLGCPSWGMGPGRPLGRGGSISALANFF